MVHSEITKVIINASFEVLNALKPGLDEPKRENGESRTARNHLFFNDIPSLRDEPSEGWAVEP